MVVSREDETISSHRAIDFFVNQHNQDSRLLLYTSIDHRYPDPRIITRLTHYPKLRINHCSHVSIPFSSLNPHYGVSGDYQYASHPQSKEVIYGAYNRFEEKLFDILYALRITKHERRELTYNPDFEFMSSQIADFMIKNP